MKSTGKKFRIQGIAVFVVLTSLIAGFLVLFLDNILKDAIEDQGSRIMKSQIDVGSLSTSLLSQAIDIGNLQIANADKLDENLVQIGRIKFGFDGGRALSKKVIIDDMKLENLLLNQKRKVPAKPYKPAHKEPKPEKKPEEDSFAPLGIPLGLDFKNPKDILKNEKLETLEVAQNTKDELKQLEVKWKTEIDQNFSKKSLSQIKQRLENIKAKSKNLKNLESIQSIAGEIATLQKDIQARIDAIHNFQKNIETDIQKAEKMAAHIMSLPEKDFDRLRNKYSLDLKGGTGLISKLVSGPLKTKIEKAWEYYKQISPYLKSSSNSKPEPKAIERSEGQFVQFPSSDPLPHFLIRQAKLSMNVWEQDVEGSFQGLTSDPRKYGKPFVLDLTGSQTEAFKSFNMKLKLDRTRTQAADFLETRVDSLKIKPVPLGEWAILTQGFANISGEFQVQNEQTLKGDVTVRVHEALFIQPDNDSSKKEVARILGEVLKPINSFYIKAQVQGASDDFKLTLKTDLDEILSKSIRNVFDQRIKKFEADLQKLINSKTAGLLSETNGSLAELLDLKKILKKQEVLSKDLLSQTVDKSLKKAIPDPGSVLKELLPF